VRGKANPPPRCASSSSPYSPHSVLLFPSKGWVLQWGSREEQPWERRKKGMRERNEREGAQSGQEEGDGMGGRRWASWAFSPF